MTINYEYGVLMTFASIPDYDYSQTERRHGRAVVLGAGFAGLSFARVLADYFDRVVILERDSLSEPPRFRDGLPQAPHAHTLFPSGRKVLEDLLPGYRDDLLAVGAVENDSGSEWHYHYESGGKRADTPSRISSVNATRPLFEWVLRRRVAERSPVEIRDSCRFISYETADGGSTIVGVRVRNATGDEERVAADLVVDATGRTSKTPQWLERQDHPVPPKQEMTVDLAYSTGYVERPPDDVRGIIVEDDSGSVGLTPVEHDQWQFWLTGRGDDHPPSDPEAMVRVAREIGVTAVEEILDDLTWRHTDVNHYRFLSNQRYRYEALDRFPDGLLVVGDAIATFNPIFGQGMTVATLEALVLHHVLADVDLGGLAQRFFRRVEPVVDLPWFMVAAVDSTFESSSGSAPDGADSYLAYQEQVRQAATEDPEVAEALLRMAQLERPLSSLLNAAVVHRVFGEVADGTSPSGYSPSWVPASLEDVWPVLAANLNDPAGILDWPGILSDSPTDKQRSQVKSI
jgi:2-polyprenyl-6-methoxyphenol hydroxylase-like FAD-dependent oxidoreductase